MVASTSLFLLWIGILFGLMLVVAERFFCPSLELISEYLRLPPCVAGATLLSFGNGAPDVFTQLAAISQGDGDASSPGAVAMALSEPLGSGLFVGNVVMALVMLWEVGLLAATYLAFMVTTILLSRGDEPVHADPRLHELPHRLRPMDSFFRESFRMPDLSFADSASDAGGGGGNDAEAPLLLRSHSIGGIAAAARRCALASIDEGEGEQLQGAACREENGREGGSDDPRVDAGPECSPGGGCGGGQPYHQPYIPPAPLGLKTDALLEEEEAAWAAAVAGNSPPAAASPPPPTFAELYGGRGGSGGGVDGGSPGSGSGHGGGFWGSALGGGAGDVSVGRRSLGGRSASGLRREGSGRPPGAMQKLWRYVERPGLALLSVFIPRLPPPVPLRRAGVATVVVFAEAMVLLDGSAGELVSAAVALGQVHGISPALLGATLLAWGNSVSDLVSNTTLARDGLPSMAITACFASPLFVLLAGLVTTLTYATRHGNMQLPCDTSLRVLYGAATTILLGWALAVPLLFRFRLSRRVGCLALAAYLAFQAVYITSVMRESH
ncbi:hypothetical protein GPECTOR_23g48 [Gonium pectorale]|uniref:Sodium/calcium exchanger membrane region domain-containing protein n=1 Tax=Gonium pectorale TaxID=33097 RepID=A0A150GGZ8_GONPE|nr:hypothetical protein GPECTOR_23g48 [Gonium pectorale]|eukprot:KXZ49118.1 hypothetical protein GPECTOR_23g48 [Gonium pectorale]